MGLISRAFGNAGTVRAVGEVATDMAEVFRPNATRRMELSAQAQRAALDAQGDEFQYARNGLFDRVVNGINRLPRPMLALGTLGLFVFAMTDPVAFSDRMVGLTAVPEPLWWLLGAIVSFYFGAREMFYFRTPNQVQMPRTGRGNVPADATDTADTADTATNPALSAWLADRQDGNS
jgi:Holin of 3TMs, for gene-transfer release